MSKCCRHWKALMRKNWINWYRRPKCSFFEILWPVLTMFVMVFMRHYIHTSTVPYDRLIPGLKMPTIPGLTWDSDATKKAPDGAWSTSLIKQRKTAKDLNDFFAYNGYNTHVGEDYSLLEDIRGPFYFLPGDCLKVKSFQLPEVESPIIAVVGEWNQATYMMQNYLEELIAWQQSNIPGSTILKQLMEKEYGKDATYPDFQFKNFTSKEELFEYTSADNYTFTPGLPGVCYGFQISQDAKNNDAWNLELYFNDQSVLGGSSSSGIPTTQVPAYNPLQTTPDVGDYESYLRRGYATLHNLAANIILKLETGNDNAGISLLSKPMPAETNVSDSFKQVWAKIFPFLIILMFIPPVYNMVSLLVREKETRIKESMRMMGMGESAYWLSWYAYYTLVSTVIVLLAWGVLMINCIVYTNSFLVLCFLFLFAQSVLGQIIFLSSLFENSKYSGIIASLVYFGFSLLGIPVQQSDSSTAYKLALSIFPQVAMQQTCFVLGHLEGAGVGVTYENSSEIILNYSFNQGLIMLAASCVLFSLLGFYLTAVLPRSAGERSHPCCCFMMCCKKRSQQVEEVEQFSDAAHLMARNDPFELKYIDKKNYEAVPLEVARLENEDQYLKIEDLTKVYSNGLQAINGINLKMYKGQIFALLGHNGAGKSTMISVLTGLMGRTAGRARLFGKDLFGDMDKARESMGVCPQHDILFDLLTPEEHLDIFYDFKGGEANLKKEELKGLITDVGITLDKNRMTYKLSGGNKRKLSVAIALCGNSRFVMLDEPTAGMDLSARRSLWDMLKNYRQNRIIILTTHYMDEADVLGDRIGIMANGGIECLGSSLFLKNRYGAGYKLTMVKQNAQPNEKIQTYLETRFGVVECLSEVSQEITFKINYQQAARFQTFFSEFDNDMRELDILSYGISMTTLEEVFLEVNGGMKAKETKQMIRGSKQVGSVADEERDNQIIKGSCFKSTGALLTKRFHIYKRDKCGLMCEIVIPIFLVILGLAFCEVGWLTSSEAFTLETSAFPSPQRMLFNQNNVQTSDLEYTPQEIAQNLPNYSDFWEITYDDTAGISYDQYYDQVTSQQLVGDEEPSRFGSFQIFKADKENYDFQVNMFLNSTSAQAVPYFSQFIYQSILSTVKPEIQFNVVTAPLPTFYVFTTRAQSSQAIDFAVIMSVALALMPSVTLALIILERENKLKHMQMVQGVSLTAYWISNLIHDILKMYIPIAIIIALNAAFSLQYEGVWQLLVLYPISVVPFTYLTSFLFTRDTTGQIMCVFINFMAGGIMPNVIYFLQNIPFTADLGDKMRWWFVWIPSFCVGEGITFSSTYKELNLARTGLIAAGFDVQPINTDVYAWVNLSGNYVIMVCISIVCLLALWLIESGLLRFCSNFSVRFVPDSTRNFDLDDDVIAEEERLAQQDEDQDNNSHTDEAPLLDQETQRSNKKDLIRVNNFGMAYSTLFTKPYLAVERISFGVNIGECFALLGVNGAGKSTVFKSLTGDVVPTRGDCQINGRDIIKNFSKSVQRMGYCPQNDALFPLMTVEEHLYLYAKTKGISKDNRQQVIKDAIEKLDLTNHYTKLSCNLSGGNKRKLQVAIALLGSPKILLLDEPSTGMDPEARRHMWSVIEKISTQDKRSTVILTTHSMEEAEALSTKMGIMARGGVFRCFGSSQHIKNKFSTGYELEIKIKKTAETDLEQFKNDMGLKGQMSHRVNLEETKKGLIKASFDERISANFFDTLILNQIRKDGVGSDLFIEASLNDGEVRMSSLVYFCYVQTHGMNFIKELAKSFSKVDLLEHCGDFFKLRVARENKTIGFLFGLIESKKQEMNIQEYGVCQTSLEQIFQDFAGLSAQGKAAFSFRLNELNELQLLNPNHESITEEQKLTKGNTQNELLLSQPLLNTPSQITSEDM